MGNRMRITHESLLRLIAAGADETSAPSARWLHGSGWTLLPASNSDIARGSANWQLIWRTPDEIEPQRREMIDTAAASFAALYDVIW